MKYRVTSQDVGIGVVVLMLLLSLVVSVNSSCATGAPKAQTNPVGFTAYYATQVMNGVATLQDAVIMAEANKLIATDKARQCIEITKQLGQKGVQLADALTDLQKLPLTDITRQAKTQQIITIIQAMKTLVFKVILPIDNEPTRVYLSTIADQVVAVLIQITGALQP